MSMLSEQVNQLKEEAKWLEKDQEKRLASILRQAADTIEALSAKLEVANMERSDRYYGGWWISVEDRLPEIRKPVLICDARGNVCIRQIMQIDELGMVWWSQYSTAIAWQPLPEPYHP